MDEYDANLAINDLVRLIVDLSKELGELTEKYNNHLVFDQEQELLRQGKQTAEDLKKGMK